MGTVIDGSVAQWSHARLWSVILVRSSVPPLISCIALAKLFELSLCRFSHLEDGDDSVTCLEVMMIK